MAALASTSLSCGTQRTPAAPGGTQTGALAAAETSLPGLASLPAPSRRVSDTGLAVLGAPDVIVGHGVTWDAGLLELDSSGGSAQPGYVVFGLDVPSGSPVRLDLIGGDLGTIGETYVALSDF